MARRRIADEPNSRLAIWARRHALFSLVAAIISIIIIRAGLLEFGPGLATFAGALVFAVMGILLAFGAFIVIWKDGLGGLGHAFSAVAIGGLLLLYPAYLGYKAYKLPAITDITTDPIDPPRFEAITRLRSRVANPVIYAGLYTAEQQRNAYPEIEPLLVSVPPKAAYDAALAVAEKRRWSVIDARDPQGGRRDGRIEAVARTPIMGFRDDVVIRIRRDGEGSRIDMRSSSRYGRHDLGANASRIQSFLETIEENVDSEQEKQEKLERRKQQAVKKAPAKGQPAKR
jgi:uncharacterized protein (DUF1499 family)